MRAVRRTVVGRITASPKPIWRKIWSHRLLLGAQMVRRQLIVDPVLASGPRSPRLPVLPGVGESRG
ncbi:hypothetical protein GQ85_08295, partial [Rhodococcus rhodochrous]